MCLSWIAVGPIFLIMSWPHTSDGIYFECHSFDGRSQYFARRPPYPRPRLRVLRELRRAYPDSPYLFVT
jgi:hypothetical protein